MLVWAVGPPSDAGNLEDSNATTQYRLTSPSGTTTGFRAYGTLTRAESPMNVLRFNTLFDGEDPRGG